MRVAGGDTDDEEGKSLIRAGDAADKVPGAVDDWNVDFSSDVTAWKDLNAQQRTLALAIIFAKVPRPPRTEYTSRLSMLC